MISTDEKSVVNKHCNDIETKFAVGITESQEKLPTFYWLPKLHKRPYKARFIANSSSCTTTSLSKVLTSCLTAIKNHWIKYCEKTYEREGINYFWSIKNSTEILNKLKTKGFQASTISTYDFSTLNTTLPHNLIRNQLVDLIENTFRREEALYLACNEELAFFASEDHKKYDLWSCQKVTNALNYLLDNIYMYIRFGSKLYRQNVGIPMGTNCAPLVADLFLFCYERDFLNIYPAELQLNKANASDTEAAFLDLNLSIHNDIVSTKIYDKRDDFNFDIVNFPFLDGDVPQRPSYSVYISQLIHFARASLHVTDFNNRNKFLTAKLLKQGYRYHKLRKAFSKFYRRHFELIEKYHVSQKKLMQQGICNPEFYGDLVY